MIEGVCANLWQLIAEGTVLVHLVLKEILIDGTRSNSITAGQFADVGEGRTLGDIPLDMKSESRTFSGEVMNLPSVG